MSLALVRTARIAGKTIGANGETFQGGIEMRTSQRSGAVVSDSVGAITEPDGTFEFPNVPPGEYVVHAFKGQEAAFQFVSINGADVTGLVMQTSVGPSIRGHVTFENATTPNRFGFVISPVLADPEMAPFFGAQRNVEIRDDWSFDAVNISGPRLFRLARSPAGWALKAVRVNGADVTDTPTVFGSASDIEVVVTDQITEVSGSVSDARGLAVADYTAIVFATDRRLWYDGSRFFSVSRPREDGTFSIRGLPPGEYFVAAVDRIPGTEADGEWQDPELLESITNRAQTITLTDGQKVAVTPRLIVR